MLIILEVKVAKLAKTYNSGYSLVVTHLTTNPPVRCLNRAERTGSLVFNVLWSYVKKYPFNIIYNLFLNSSHARPAERLSFSILPEHREAFTKRLKTHNVQNLQTGTVISLSQYAPQLAASRVRTVLETSKVCNGHRRI
jgi:hypothetical protein